MIFPGMDPYLENPALWTGVHHRLITVIADLLQPALGERYIATVEERVYLEQPGRSITPDVWIRPLEPAGVAPAASSVRPDTPLVVQVEEEEVREPYLEILDRLSGLAVVAVLEVLSPTNKTTGPGFDSYRAKQEETLRSTAHLIEIDLLRSGRHVLAVSERHARKQGHYDYAVCVSRTMRPRDKFDLYLRTIRDRLPNVGVPLAMGDADVGLDLQAAVAEVYRRGRFDLRIDYSQPPDPRLAPRDESWAKEILAQAKR